MWGTATVALDNPQSRTSVYGSPVTAALNLGFELLIVVLGTDTNQALPLAPIRTQL